MAEQRKKDVENGGYRTSGPALGFQGRQRQKLGVRVEPFAGRLGGCGCDVPESDNEGAKVTDGSPCKGWAEMFDLRQFRALILWKAALMEGMGTYCMEKTNRACKR